MNNDLDTTHQNIDFIFIDNELICPFCEGYAVTAVVDSLFCFYRCDLCGNDWAVLGDI